MYALLSLIVVYFLQHYLGNYPFFQKLRQICTADWLDDLIFKIQMFANNFDKAPAMGSCVLLVIGMSVCVLLLQTIVRYGFGWLGTMVFNIAILFYCLTSAAKKKHASIFVEAFEHNFVMLFWYTLIGPAGAVLSWLFMLGGEKHTVIHRMEHTEDDTIVNINIANELCYAKNISNCLFTLHTIAAWLPARIAGLIFSLVGDFEKGFSCWKTIISNPSMSHMEVLDLCGDGSLGRLSSQQSQLLVERAIVAWFIFCILMSLIIK